jgi:hypothetical protein
VRIVAWLAGPRQADEPEERPLSERDVRTRLYESPASGHVRSVESDNGAPQRRPSSTQRRVAALREIQA